MKKKFFMANFMDVWMELIFKAKQNGELLFENDVLMEAIF